MTIFQDTVECPQIEGATPETKAKNQTLKMKILKNTSSISDQEVIRRVEDFNKFFSAIFPAPTGQHKYITMPDGTVSSHSGLDAEIVIDHDESSHKA